MLVEPGWPEARVEAHSAGHRLPTVQMALSDALGAATAEPIRARTPLPPLDVSSMDGWVVSGDPPWRVVGEILAGHGRRAPLAPGQACTIATGAAIPTGSLGVLRREDGVLDAGGRVLGSVVPGQDVRLAGEEARAGDVLIDSGTVVGPAHVGLAAAGGHDRLLMVRRPRARVLVFGDELLHEGPARDGRIRDSLGPQLPAWLVRLGVDVVGWQWVADGLEAHVAAVASCHDVDLVVSSGGTAAGPVDHLRAAVSATGGQVAIDTVACRPGHPMLLAGWDGRWLVGLPGNPQAAVVALLTLGQPLCAALQGRRLPALGSVLMTEDVRTHGRTTRLIPCVTAGEHATPTPHIGSGMLRGLAAAEGFAIIPPGGCIAGDRVAWLALP
ncbi:MAG: molybdopterin molybdotransferase MoeA [Candidatus Nanopelagicales bacterium]